MSDNDQIVAAIFAATLNAREPTAAGLMAQYEYFMRELPARRRAEQARADETADAAWRERS